MKKYLSATMHIYDPGVLLVGRKFWDTLNTDEKKNFQDSCTEAREFERKASRDLDARVLAEMKTKGMQVNEIAPRNAPACATP